MHVHFLDPYQPRSSPIHTLDARVKLILALAFILTTALTPQGAWPIYILLLALIFSMEILSSLGIGYVLKRSLLAAPFMLAALPLLLTTKGETLFQLSLGGWDLLLTVEGLERFLSITFKSFLSVQSAILLAASTPFPELLQAMRTIGIPRLLVAMFGLMWRYLFVLADEAVRLMRARTARSGQSEQPGLRSGGPIVWRAHVTGGMAGNLFLRAFERSDRIYMAMLSRGYDGEVRYMPLSGITASHWLTLAVGLVILIFLLFSGILFWG